MLKKEFTIIEILKKAIIVIAIIILVLMSSLVLIFCYRSLTRNVLEVKSIKVSLSKDFSYFLDKNKNESYFYEMNSAKKKLILQHPKDYIWIRYYITLINKSGTIIADNVLVNPMTLENKKQSILWKDEAKEESAYLSLEDENSIVFAKTEGHFLVSTIINRKGLTDKQVLNIAKSLQFKVDYITYDNFLYAPLTSNETSSVAATNATIVMLLTSYQISQQFLLKDTKRIYIDKKVHKMQL